MKTAMRWLGVALAVIPGLCAQQLRWQVPVAGPSTTQYYWMAPFVDYDHDGYRDFLRVVTPVVGPTHLQIGSGLDASTLWDQTHPLGYTGANACHAGDMDGDGEPDIAVVRGGPIGTRMLEVFSPRTGRVLWQDVGSMHEGFGSELLGDIDVNGDGRPDLITKTLSFSAADVHVYDNGGTLLYVVPCLSNTRYPISLCKQGDLDGDGCDDFLIGCNDASDRGLQWLVSGRTGSTIRESFGLLPGDRTSAHISNLGDIDGDGVDDYAAFPYQSAARLIAVAYSGATGAVLRSWDDYANSVVTGEDFDQDGVNDIVTGADWIIATNVNGRTYCHSGRDGSELWRVDNFQAPISSGSNGTSGWMKWCAGLGTQPGNPYPVVAWMDINWWTVTTTGGRGRIRAYGAERAGQGPVTGTACTSSGPLPLIGVRKLGAQAANTGSRLTVAKTHANALAALHLAFAPLPAPIDLTPFGFANCTVYVDAVVSYLRVTGTTGIDRGYAAVDLAYPLAAAAVGTDVVGQWLVFDPATLAYAATQMHAVRLQ